jgi:2-polyprenyl-3-methyl-5-hydroxy-6-metoxy-1,4-benzoquinol methylase
MGYLLHSINELGGKVVGLEPGAHGQRGSAKFEVPVIRDFFPSNKVKGRFDFILGFALLEHPDELGEFFRAVSSQLKQNGLMIFTVPDWEPTCKRAISLFFYMNIRAISQQIPCGQLFKNSPV